MKKKIAFYSSKPLDDKKNWSGTMYKMYEQLLALDYEVIWIPQVKLNDKEINNLDTIAHIFSRIFNRGYNKLINIYKAKTLSKKLQKELSTLDFNLLFVPTYIPEISFLKINKPILYLNDANAAQLFNYYPYYSGFGKLSKIETEFVEKKMLKNVDLAIFSSEWATDFAKKHYKINPTNLATIKFGSTKPNENFKDLKKDNKIYTFLFLAVDWDRKRGQLVYESLKILRYKNFPIQLKIVGCSKFFDEDWIETIPFLNKNIPEDFDALQKIIATSHFLYVPSKADCTPIVFCEAAAYGLPVISTNTGGISAHVENGITGILLNEKAVAKDYALEIEEILKDPEKIKKMSQESRRKYANELNWDSWRINMSKFINKLL